MCNVRNLPHKLGFGTSEILAPLWARAKAASVTVIKRVFFMGWIGKGWNLAGLGLGTAGDKTGSL